MQIINERLSMNKKMVLCLFSLITGYMSAAENIAEVLSKLCQQYGFPTATNFNFIHNASKQRLTEAQNWLKKELKRNYKLTSAQKAMTVKSKEVPAALSSIEWVKKTSPDHFALALELQKTNIAKFTLLKNAIEAVENQFSRKFTK